MTVDEIKKLKAKVARLERLRIEIEHLEDSVTAFKARPHELTICNTTGTTYTVTPPKEITEKIILLLETHLAKLKKQFDEA